MSPRLALYKHLALGGPKQSPLRRKVLHLDHFRWTQVVAALPHPGARILADGLRRVLQEIATRQFTFDQDGTSLRRPPDDVGILIGRRGELVHDHGAFSPQPANSDRN